jgi:uncharacterized protein (TIGR03067 family)
MRCTLPTVAFLSLILSAAGWALDEKPAQEKKVDNAELEKKELVLRPALVFGYRRFTVARNSRSAGSAARKISLDGALAAFQGTWNLVAHEIDGKPLEGVEDIKGQLIINQEKMTYYQDGKIRHEGKVALDVTKNPKQLVFAYTSGRSDVAIYVSAGNYMITCRNTDGKTFPSEFASGTEKGGTYLDVWKREK